MEFGSEEDKDTKVKETLCHSCIGSAFTTGRETFPWFDDSLDLGMLKGGFVDHVQVFSIIQIRSNEDTGEVEPSPQGQTQMLGKEEGTHAYPRNSRRVGYCLTCFSLCHLSSSYRS